MGNLTNKQKDVLRIALTDGPSANGIITLLDNVPLLSSIVRIPYQSVRTLNATPFTILPAPGAGLAYILRSALVQMKYGSAAYDSVGSGDDLAFKYTNAAGATLITVETTGFLDQTSNQLRFASSNFAVAITPVNNAPIVANILAGEIYTAAGNSDLYVQLGYSIVPTSLS